MLTVGIIHYYDPAQSSLYPKCPTYWLTKYYCPGCGSLRALHQLTCGNILRACHFNLLAVISLPLLLILSLDHLSRLFHLKWLPKFVITKNIGRIILVTVLVYSVLRNIPYYPFTLLAPHG